MKKKKSITYKELGNILTKTLEKLATKYEKEYEKKKTNNK